MSLEHNHFRPTIELNLSRDTGTESEEIETDLADLRNSGKEKEGADKNKDKEVCLMFTQGTQISLYTRTNADRHTQSTSTVKCLDDLPEATRALVSRMTTPVLLEFVGGKNHILHVNLALNFPQWAAQIRKMILERHRIRVLVDAGDQLTALQNIKAFIERAPHHLAKFCPKGPTASDRFDTNSFVANPMPHKLLGYRRSPVFKNASEYVVQGLASIELDRNSEVRKIKAYEGSVKTLILTATRGGPLVKDYKGFISKPNSREHILQAGETFEILFGNVKWDYDAAPWRVTVMQSGDVQIDDMTPVFIERGRYKNSDEYCQFEPSVVDTRKLSKIALKGKIEASKGNKVTVKLVNCDSAYKIIRAAYLAFPVGTQIGNLLLGLRPDLLKSKDLYQHIREQVPDPEKFMRDLNPRQLEAVQAAMSILGGFLFTQGPPGTGKTHLLLQFLAGFLGATIKTVVIIVSPTNTGANDLAQGACELLRRLLEEFPEIKAKKPYIIRAHSDKTEDDISRTQGPRRKPETPRVVKHAQPTQARKSPISDHTQSLDELRATIKPRFDGIHDDRVARVDYSIGYMKLLISGVIPDSEYADPQTERFAKFRELHAKQSRGERLTNDEEKLWTRDGDKLTEIAVSNASAIISTTATMSNPTILGYIKDKVVAVLLDESAFEREDSLMPLFSTRFPLDPCFVMVGDQQQLEPITLAEEKHNAFQPQLATSFMARMIEIGMDYTMLTEQYRMVEQISEIANELTYDNKLIDSPCTQWCHRPLAREFQEFTLQNYGIATNRLMIDLPPSKTNTVGRNDSSSKSNDFFVCITAEIVKKLLATFGTRATIGVLTPYGAQRRRYKAMLSLMRDKKLKNLQQVTVDSYDRAQGCQFDICVIDLLVGESAGFMESENRLNVAMTRARDGLIVICSHGMISATHYKNEKSTPYLKRLIECFKGKTSFRPHSDEFPATEYLVPEIARTTWVGR